MWYTEHKQKRELSQRYYSAFYMGSGLLPQHCCGVLKIVLCWNRKYREIRWGYRGITQAGFKWCSKNTTHVQWISVLSDHTVCYWLRLESRSELLMFSMFTTRACRRCFAFACAAPYLARGTFHLKLKVQSVNPLVLSSTRFADQM